MELDLRNCPETRRETRSDLVSRNKYTGDTDTHTYSLRIYTARQIDEEDKTETFTGSSRSEGGG